MLKNKKEIMKNMSLTDMQHLTKLVGNGDYVDFVKLFKRDVKDLNHIGEKVVSKEIFGKLLWGALYNEEYDKLEINSGIIDSVGVTENIEDKFEIKKFYSIRLTKASDRIVELGDKIKSFKNVKSDKPFKMEYTKNEIVNKLGIEALSTQLHKKESNQNGYIGIVGEKGDEHYISVEELAMLVFGNDYDKSKYNIKITAKDFKYVLEDPKDEMDKVMIEHDKRNFSNLSAIKLFSK